MLSEVRFGVFRRVCLYGCLCYSKNNGPEATSSVTWTTPAAITLRDDTDAAELDATASVPGNIVCNPASGKCWERALQTLSVKFVPTAASG